MATRKDFEKIEAIGHIKAITKRDKSSYSKLLSQDEPIYEKAINAQRRAATATLVCSLIGFAVASTYLVLFGIQQNNDIWYTVGQIIGVAIIALFSIIPPLKIHSLKTTPTVVLTLTIVQLLASLALFSGLLPLIAVIFNVLALTQWSTYRSWYNEFDIDQIEHSAESQTTKTKKPTLLITLLILVIVLAIAGSAGGYFYGRNTGWIDGYNSGHSDGESEGYERGKKDGTIQGFTWNDMQQKYQQGYSDGYARAGCVSFGVNCR